MSHTSLILWSLVFSLTAAEASQLTEFHADKMHPTNIFARLDDGIKENLKVNVGLKKGSLKEIQLSEEEIQHLVAFRDENGNTALHYLQHFNYVHFNTTTLESIIETLLKNKANINAHNHDGLTPFEIAVSESHSLSYAHFMAKLLHRYGAKPNNRLHMDYHGHEGTSVSVPFITRLLMQDNEHPTYGTVNTIEKLIAITTENKDAIQLDDLIAPIVPFRFAANADEIASLQQEGWQQASAEDVALYDLPLHDTCAVMVKPSMNRTPLEYAVVRFSNEHREQSALSFLDLVYTKSTDEGEKNKLIQQAFYYAKSLKKMHFMKHMFINKPWRMILSTTPSMDDNCSIMEAEIKEYIKASLMHSEKTPESSPRNYGDSMRDSLRWFTHDPLPHLTTSLIEHVTKIAHELEQSGMQVDMESTIKAVTENTPEAREAKRALERKEMKERAKRDAEQVLLRKQKDEERYAKQALEHEECKKREAEQLALRIKEEEERIATINLRIKENMEWAAQFPEEHAAKLAELRKKRAARQALFLKERAAQRALQFGPLSKFKQ